MNMAMSNGNRRHGRGAASLARAAALALLVAGACAGADLDAAGLVNLLNTYEWFQLHDAVAAGAHPPLFVRGSLACIFNDVRRCERDMDRVVKSKAPERDVTIAHDLLTYMYVRAGRFGPALDHRRASMRLVHRTSKDGLTSLLEGLIEPPEMSVEAFHPSTIQCEPPGGVLVVPLTINGKQADFVLDTAADYPTATEPEAQRLGLRVSPGVCGRLDDASGKGVNARCAVADRLDLGGIRLRNVPFMVLPARAEIAWLRGAIGLQILLACRTVSWNEEGKLRLGYRAQGPKSKPNLYFDDLDLVVRTGYGNRDLAFVLDTGNGYVSRVSARFANEFPDVINASSERSKVVEVGAGDTATVDTVLFPNLTLGVGGIRATLPSVPVIPFGQPQHYGLLGYDVIRQAHTVSIDFERMTLTLQ